MDQGVRIRRVKVDQTMAELFLSMEQQPERGVDGTNRRWSPEVVNNYAIDLLTDEWGFCHQGMAFVGFLDNGSAKFVDGGQRARAIIQAATVGAVDGDDFYPPNSDVSMEVFVTEGLSPDDVLVMDIGKRRVPADFMNMSGEINAAVLASLVRLCYLYEHVPWSREGWSTHRLTPKMRKEYLKANPQLREAVTHGSRLHRVMTPSAASAGWFLGTKAGQDSELILEFMQAVLDGINLDKEDPARLLREMLLNARTVRRRVPREDQLAVFIKAYLRWLNKTPTKHIRWRTTGDAPEGMPRFP